MPTTQPRIYRTRSTIKPDIRLQVSATVSTDVRRVENVEYQLIDRRPGGSTGHRTQLFDITSGSSNSSTSSESSQRPLANINYTTLQPREITQTTPGGRSATVVMATNEAVTTSNAVNLTAAREFSNFVFNSTLVPSVNLFADENNTLDYNEFSTSNNFLTETTSDVTSLWTNDKEIHNTSQTQSNVTSLKHSTVFNVNSSSTRNTTSFPRDVIIDDNNSRSRDFRKLLIVVNETTATTFDRFPHLNDVTDRAEWFSRPMTNESVDTRSSGTVVYFHSPGGVKVAAMSGALSLLLVLLVVPMMSIVICRRLRRTRRGGNEDLENKRKKMLSGHHRIPATCPADYSSSYDTSLDASLPLKFSGECYTGNSNGNNDFNRRNMNSPRTASGEHRHQHDVAAAKFRTKRYRTRIRDDVELERLRQSDDWGTPPPSYRQLIPGSPSSLSSAAHGGPLAYGCASALPTRRCRRPVLFGGSGVIDVSLTKLYEPIAPEPPPPPLPPRKGVFRGTPYGSSDAIGDAPIASRCKPEVIDDKQPTVDQLYGYLLRAAPISCPDEELSCRHSRPGRRQGQCRSAVLANGCSGRPLPRINCDIVRSSLISTSVAVRCDFSPEDGDSFDRNRRRFPKMGRSCLMESLRHRQAMSLVSPVDTNSYFVSTTTSGLTPPVSETGLVIQNADVDAPEKSAQLDIIWKAPKHIVNAQNTTV